MRIIANKLKTLNIADRIKKRVFVKKIKRNIKIIISLCDNFSSHEYLAKNH